MEENIENKSDIALRQPQATPQSMAGFSALSMFFDSTQFDTAQRVCRMLAMSDLVPKEYHYEPVNYMNPDGTVNEYLKQQNDAALSKAMANCMIALNKAANLRTDPLTIMQNMGIVYGRPSWSSPFLIASVNACGRFNALRFKFRIDGRVNETYTVYKKDGGGVKKTIDMDNMICVAYTSERGSDEVLESSEVSIRMAYEERWIQKDGSKWLTMPKQMLMYRAAAFWTRSYAPEISMGMYTIDENEDIGPIMDAEIVETTLNQQRKVVSFEEQKQIEAPEPKQPVEAPQAEERQSFSPVEGNTNEGKTEEAPY